MGTFSSFQQQKRGQSAAPTPSFARPTRPFAPVSSSSSQPASHDVQANLEHAARFGYSLDRISIFPPASNNTPMQEASLQGNFEPTQNKENNTGLPDTLKAGIENLSGMSMDDVQVHYNSSKPAQVQALAYTQGTDIHMGPGQEEHLPHEAWHVVQQKQGRVKATLQARRVAINGDEGLEREADVMGAEANQVKSGNSQRKEVSSSSSVGEKSNLPPFAPLQRKLVLKGDTYKTENDLQLPQGKAPSDVVRRLLQSDKNYYMPDDGSPDYEAAQFRVLEEAKYLLGETHGDGTWDQRTKPWTYISKMKEGIKGMTGQSEVEEIAIREHSEEEKTKAQQTGSPLDEALPLEDMHAYALTHSLMAKQLLTNYDLIKSGQSQHIEKELIELAAIIIRYREVGNKWLEKLELAGEPSRDTLARAVHFTSISEEGGKEPAWTVLEDVVKQIRKGDSLNKKEVGAILTMLTEIVPHLIELIDTRPRQPKFGGLYMTKEGPDPITNRAEITKLHEGRYSGNVNPFTKALEEGNKVREQAMARNIRNARAPLLVQVGDAHVDNLKVLLGTGTIPIKKTVDFVNATTEK